MRILSVANFCSWTYWRASQVEVSHLYVTSVMSSFNSIPEFLFKGAFLPHYSNFRIGTRLLTYATSSSLYILWHIVRCTSDTTQWARIQIPRSVRRPWGHGYTQTRQPPHKPCYTTTILISPNSPQIVTHLAGQCYLVQQVHSWHLER
jgi:hypothetical protein